LRLGVPEELFRREAVDFENGGVLRVKLPYVRFQEVRFEWGAHGCERSLRGSCRISMLRGVGSTESVLKITTGVFQSRKASMSFYLREA
jgi:hypothetical protein